MAGESRLTILLFEAGHQIRICLRDSGLIPDLVRSQAAHLTCQNVRRQSRRGREVATYPVTSLLDKYGRMMILVQIHRRPRPLPQLLKTTASSTP